MEEMDEAGSEDDEGVDMEEEGAGGEAGTKVYIPGVEPFQPGEELEMDRSAYRMYHECQTGELLLTYSSANMADGCLKVNVLFSCLFAFAGAPCLSFDVIRDGGGDCREQFPVSMLLCAGTQAETAQANRCVRTLRTPAYAHLGRHRLPTLGKCFCKCNSFQLQVPLLKIVV